MFIVDCIPLTKIPLPSPQILTYFSKQEVKRGAFLRVPLGKKEVGAIAFNCSSALERKLEIKRGEFKLKTINDILSSAPLILENQLELAIWLHKYYLTPLGPISKLFLPASFLKRKKPFSFEINYLPPATNYKLARPLLCWGENRFNFYLEEIERVQKEKKQVLILVPEVRYIHDLRDKIKGDISLLYSEQNVSQKLKEWVKIYSGEKNIIIGTRSAVFAPFNNLGLIIIDKEENPSFKSWEQSPRYDAKVISQELSKITGAKLILGTDFPSVESYYFATTKKYHFKELSPVHDSSRIKLVDMREEIKKRNFSIFSEELQDSISEIVKNRGQAILFINRRGSATSVFCRDCGHVIKCKDCEAPMVYHRLAKTNKQEETKDMLVCHHCGVRERAPIVCPACRSWKIKYAGTGTQKVADELRKLFKSDPKKIKIKIARLDSDTAPTQKEQEKILKDFQDRKYDILVGTQLLLKGADSKLEVKNIELIGIILIDSLLNFPDFRSSEKAIQLLQGLKNLSKKMLIQTYNPQLPLFEYFKKGNYSFFFEEEIKSREKFNYPPFSEIIQLSLSRADLKRVENEASILGKKLEKLFAKENLSQSIEILGPISALVSRIKGKYVQRIILKLKLPHQEEVKILLIENFPKDWEIDVNPQSLL